jgi:nitrogen fixation protein NifU and related proteins
MSDLDDLYQSIILDHNRRPRHYGELADANRSASGRNPLCGDEVTVWVQLDADDRIGNVSFVGKGCAISKASTSLMTDAVLGRTRTEALQLFDHVHDLVTGKCEPESVRGSLGAIAALGGVSRFPVRVKCASLGWHAFRNALVSEPAVATTEPGP